MVKVLKSLVAERSRSPQDSPTLRLSDSKNLNPYAQYQWWLRRLEATFPSFVKRWLRGPQAPSVDYFSSFHRKTPGLLYTRTLTLSNSMVTEVTRSHQYPYNIKLKKSSHSKTLKLSHKKLRPGKISQTGVYSYYKTILLKAISFREVFSSVDENTLSRPR